VKESAERVVVILAPADVRKDVPAFDRPIAIGILAGSNQINHQPLTDFLITGERYIGRRTRL